MKVVLIGYCLFMCILVSVPFTESTRSLTLEINPNCTDESCDATVPWLAHTEAPGTNDSLHHLWGGVGAPSMIVAYTTKDAKLNVLWNKTKMVSVSFDPKPLYTFGIMIPNLILYNDANDTGTLQPDYETLVVPMRNFTWIIKDCSNSSIDEITMTMETIKFNNQTLDNNTRLVIQLVAYGIDGRPDIVPRLLKTPNSGQLEIILDDLSLETLNITNALQNMTGPRWALDMVFFSEENLQANLLEISSSKSLDDEYAPGIFDLFQITTDKSRSSNEGGYLQWRPVCYTSEDKNVINSNVPNFNSSVSNPPFPPLKIISYSVAESLAYAFFKEDLLSISVMDNVAIGLSADGFYSSTNYTSWTFALGYGSPPKEKFSSGVIIVISLGVGLPCLLFIVGGAYIARRKFKKSD